MKKLAIAFFLSSFGFFLFLEAFPKKSICPDRSAFLDSPIKRQDWSDDSIQQVFDRIPKEDQEVLEAFFRDLIQKEKIGYVLHGEKPIACASYDNPVGSPCLFSNYGFYNLKMKNGMECWRKYCHLFPSKEYLFLFKGNPSSDSCIYLILINKDRFIETVAKYHEKFQSILGKGVSGESLLELMRQEDDIWEKVFKNNHELLGILFGFGPSNAALFQRRSEISESLYASFFTLKKIKRMPRQGYASIENEIEGLETRLQPFPDGCSEIEESFMLLPQFGADVNSEETRELEKKYQSQRRKMLAIYGKGEFFKTALSYL